LLGVKGYELLNASMNEAFDILMKLPPGWASWYDMLEKRRRVIPWIIAS
jgi:hypothetical protein